MFKSLLKNTPPPHITTLKEIDSLYDVYFIDLWGVIHDGKEPYESAVLAVNHLLDLKKIVIFLSNMPRPSDIVVEMLKKYGVSDCFSVLTSGDCTQKFLLKNYNNKVIYHFGETVNQDILKNLDMTITKDLKKADAVLLTIFTENDDQQIEAQKLAERIGQLNLECICANPDHTAQNGTTLRRTAGYFADIIEKNGGTVHYIGKPFIEIYKIAFDTFNIKDSSRCLMIGDTIETDVIGGLNAGMDTLLTLSGITYSDMLRQKCTVTEWCDKNEWPYPTYITEVLA
ncbi:MAG: TIGR01459 family HAD-type hydrolase [Proteobacteria bacterium]|nr:TIGR01459 family HAD-type hydrolase [Pseudomonadota bacterium]